MKILLLGEYSGFYKNLKSGFQKLGHDVTFVSDGHYGQHIYGDFKYPRYSGGILKSVQRNLMLPFDEKKFSEYDIVYLIDSSFIRSPKTAFTIERLKKNNGSLFLTPCSSRDSYFLRSLNELTIHPHMNDDGTINMEDAAMLDKGGYKFHDFVVSQMDGIIPISPLYALGYQDIEKPVENIPLPIEASNLQRKKRSTRQKFEAPLFFHGSQSDHGFFKGSPAIMKGVHLAKRNNNFKVDTEIIRPHSNYLEKISAFDILIDQTKAVGLGMNALIGLSRGLATLTHINQQWTDMMKTPMPPVINVSNKPESVATGIEKILQEWPTSAFDERMEASQDYVQKNHDASVIAERYLKFHKSTTSKNANGN